MAGVVILHGLPWVYLLVVVCLFLPQAALLVLLLPKVAVSPDNPLDSRVEAIQEQSKESASQPDLDQIENTTREEPEEMVVNAG
jgi:hypothetical protein